MVLWELLYSVEYFKTNPAIKTLSFALVSWTLDAFGPNLYRFQPIGQFFFQSDNEAADSTPKFYTAKPTP